MQSKNGPIRQSSENTLAFIREDQLVTQVEVTSFYPNIAACSSLPRPGAIPCSPEYPSQRQPITLRGRKGSFRFRSHGSQECKGWCCWERSVVTSEEHSLEYSTHTADLPCSIPAGFGNYCRVKVVGTVRC